MFHCHFQRQIVVVINYCLFLFVHKTHSQNMSYDWLVHYQDQGALRSSAKVFGVLFVMTGLILATPGLHADKWGLTLPLGMRVLRP